MKFIAKYLSREVRYLITGLVAGFLFCFCLWAMVVTATAAEPDAPESSESVVIVSESEIVQDEQPETADTARSEPEPVAEVVQDAEMEVDDSTSTPEPEAPAQLSAQSYIEIQPFASGAVVGVLVDLLQDNVIENDGYTDESWQRYESAMAAGWNVMSCFDVKTGAGLRNYCICSLMLDSGLRLNEAASLDVNNMHIPEGFIIVDGKGNKQRIVPVGMNTKKYLMKYLAKRPAGLPHPAFFLKDQTTPIKDNTIAQLFKRLKKRTKIPRLKAHLLRHTFATRYLENGGDIYSLQQILGHTSLEMVKRYVHTTPRKIVGKYSDFSPMDLLGKT